MLPANAALYIQLLFGNNLDYEGSGIDYSAVFAAAVIVCTGVCSGLLVGLRRPLYRNHMNAIGVGAGVLSIVFASVTSETGKDAKPLFAREGNFYASIITGRDLSRSPLPLLPSLCLSDSVVLCLDYSQHSSSRVWRDRGHTAPAPTTTASCGRHRGAHPERGHRAGLITRHVQRRRPRQCRWGSAFLWNHLLTLDTIVRHAGVETWVDVCTEQREHMHVRDRQLPSAHERKECGA